MRPRLKAAENVVVEFRDGAPVGASMRPRLKAAENVRIQVDAAAAMDGLQ